MHEFVVDVFHFIWLIFSSYGHSGVVDEGTLFQAGTEGGYVCIFDVVEDGVMYDRALEKQEGQTVVIHSTLILLLIVLMHLYICMYDRANVLVCYVLNA